MLAMAFSIKKAPPLWICSTSFSCGTPTMPMLAMAFSIKKAPPHQTLSLFLEKTISFWGARSLARENWVYTPKNRNYGKQFWPTLNPGFKGLPT
jgi:hypothetical protein